MREYIDENDKKNEIRLLFNHPLYKNKVIVIVEGRSDVKLFRNLLNSDYVGLETFDGKQRLFSAMKDLSMEYPNKIQAIADADFLNLSEKHKEMEAFSIHLTDFHDVEIMLVNSPSLTFYVDEFSTQEYLPNLREELLTIVMDAAYPVGLLRWVNDAEALNLRFEGINFGAFVKVSKMEVSLDVDAMIAEVLVRSNNKSPHVDGPFLKNKISEYSAREGCPLQVNCGHDVTKIISMIYQSRWASTENNMDQRKVESALRVGYRVDEFRETGLFERLNSAFLKSGIAPCIC